MGSGFGVAYSFLRFSFVFGYPVINEGRIVLAAHGEGSWIIFTADGKVIQFIRSEAGRQRENRV